MEQGPAEAQAVICAPPRLGAVVFWRRELARENKKAAVENLVNDLTTSKAIILADYRGLTVRQMGQLRRQLKKEGCAVKVVKNTLLQRALSEARGPDVSGFLHGPTALATCLDDNGQHGAIIST